MDFSEAYKFSGPAPAYSPDGRFLASTVEYRLIIRDAETLSVVQLYSCLDRIDSMVWSPNSMYVLCGQFSRAIIQVWSTEQSDWTCKIDEGPAGVQVRSGLCESLIKSIYIALTSGADRSLSILLLVLLMRYYTLESARSLSVSSHTHTHIYMQDAKWAPDGTAIILSAAFNIRTTVWSLKVRMVDRWELSQDT